MYKDDIVILITSGIIGIIYPSILWYVVNIMYGSV